MTGVFKTPGITRGIVGVGVRHTLTLLGGTGGNRGVLPASPGPVKAFVSGRLQVLKIHNWKDSINYSYILLVACECARGKGLGWWDCGGKRTQKSPGLYSLSLSSNIRFPFGALFATNHMCPYYGTALPPTGSSACDPNVDPNRATPTTQLNDTSEATPMHHSNNCGDEWGGCWQQ
ncbi:hypothetical protein EI94DRAFT_1704414 [Lactarius quietus]|nr:hypothetical protein EI94DRAFT_1704414 [Lactarius quietus]